MLTVIRELGPLLTAFIVVGRSGTAIATELGNMSVNREVTALRLMGIPISRFVIMPRMVGMVVSMICLTLYFDVVAILGVSRGQGQINRALPGLYRRRLQGLVDD